MIRDKRNIVFKNIFTFSVCVCVYTVACMWGAEDNLKESAPPIL